MEFEIEELPQPDAMIGYRYSDRFVSPQRERKRAIPIRPDLMDRAIFIPDEEAGS